MFLYKPKAVYAASERQCTAAGEKVQAPRSGGRSTEDIDTQTGKANVLLREHHRFVVKHTRDFKHRKAVNFQIGLCPILTCGHDYWVITEKKYYLRCNR